MKYVSLFFLVLFFVFESSFAQHFIPNDAIDDYAAAVSQMPTLINGANAGNQNGFKFEEKAIADLLKHQVKLQTQLLTNEEFLKLVGEIDELEAYAISEKMEKNTSLFTLRGYYRDQLARASGQFRDDEDNLDQIQQIVERIKNRGPEGLFIGIINILEDEQRSQLFSLGALEEKINYLKSLDISREIIQEKFNFSAHSINADEVTFEALIEELENRNSLVLELFTRIIAIHAREKPQDNEELSRFINLGKNEFPKYFQEYGRDFGLATSKAGLSLYHWFRQVITDKESKKSLEKKSAFTLAETPPYLAIFRGCFGGDCSTTHSWAYPNSPLEKDFFVINNEQVVVGYVSTTIVKDEENGRRLLLVKDLQGPNISPQVAADILHFLDTKYLKKVNAEALAITNENFITSNNYYQPLRDALLAHSSQDLLNFKFMDTEVRELFKSHVQSTSYDAPSTHQTGYLFRSTDQHRNIVVKTEKSPFDHFNLSKEEMFNTFQRVDLEYVVAELLRKLSGADDERAFKLSFKEVELVARLYHVVENRTYEKKDSRGRVTEKVESKPIKEYEEAIHSLLEENFSEDEISLIYKKHSDLFIPGKLRAPDLFKTSNLSALIKIHEEILWLFQNADISDYLQIFREKIANDPDEDFKEKLAEILKAGNEVAFNNAAILFGRGLKITEDPDINRPIMDQIKGDLLINITSFKVSDDQYFRYTSSENASEFISKFNYNNKIGFHTAFDNMNNALVDYNISWNEAAAHPILQKRIGLSLITYLGVKSNDIEATKLAIEKLKKLPPEIVLSGLKLALHNSVSKYISDVIFDGSTSEKNIGIININQARGVATLLEFSDDFPEVKSFLQANINSDLFFISEYTPSTPLLIQAYQKGFLGEMEISDFIAKLVYLDQDIIFDEIYQINTLTTSLRYMPEILDHKPSLREKIINKYNEIETFDLLQNGGTSLLYLIKNHLIREDDAENLRERTLYHLNVLRSNNIRYLKGQSFIYIILIDLFHDLGGEMTTEEFRSDASIIKNISTFGEEAAEALEKLEKDLFPHSNYGTCSAVLTVH